MKRIYLISLLATLSFLTGCATAVRSTNAATAARFGADVIVLDKLERGARLPLTDLEELGSRGVTEDVILAHLQRSNDAYRLTEVVGLREAGITDRVINYLLAPPERVAWRARRRTPVRGISRCVRTSLPELRFRRPRPQPGHPSLWRTPLMRAPRHYALAAFLAAFGTLQSAEPQSPKTAVPKSASVTKKKEYELPKTGVNIARKEGGWINVEGSGTRFIVKFFDKEKKLVPPDVERGLARFNYAAKNDTRAPLHREGETLATPATIRRPHNFHVILSLFTGEVGEASEVFTFKYP